MRLLVSSWTKRSVERAVSLEDLELLEALKVGRIVANRSLFLSTFNNPREKKDSILFIELLSDILGNCIKEAQGTRSQKDGTPKTGLLQASVRFILTNF